MDSFGSVTRPLTRKDFASLIYHLEQFVQDSCDVLLMAWLIIDTESKQARDAFSSTCCIEGIPIDRISFIDDLAEFAKPGSDIDEKYISN